MPTTFSFDEANAPITFSFEDAGKTEAPIPDISDVGWETPMTQAERAQVEGPQIPPLLDQFKAYKEAPSLKGAFDIGMRMASTPPLGAALHLLAPETGVKYEEFLQKPLKPVEWVYKNASLYPIYELGLAHLKSQEGLTGEIGKAASGEFEAIDKMSDFLRSPQGLAMTGLGGMPTAAQRIMGAGFAAQMATQIPEEWGNIKRAIKSGDPTDIAESFATGLGNLAMVVGGTAGALMPKRVPKPPIIRDITEISKAGPIQGVREMLANPPEEGLSDKAFALGKQVKTVDEVKDLLRLREKSSKDALDAFEDRMEDINKLPPEQREAAINSPKTTELHRKASMGTQIVNETLEKATGFNVTKNKPGETFPVPLTSEQFSKLEAEVKAETQPKVAAEVAPEVAPKEEAVTPAAPTQTENIHVKNAQQVEGMTSRTQFARWSSEQPKGAMGAATTVGWNSPTAEFRDYLKQQWDRFVADQKDTTKPESERLLSQNKAKFFREAYEAATGTGVAEPGSPFRRDNPNYKPPFPLTETEKGPTYAAKEGQVEEGVQPERERTDAQRVPAEASAGYSVQPAAQGQAPSAEGRPTTPEVLLSQPQPVPAEGAGKSPTGIRNAVVDQERAARGLPPAMEPARRSFGEVWDRVMDSIDKDPIAYNNRMETLLNELRDKPRALTDSEDAMLLHKQIELQNAYNRETSKLTKAFEEGRTDDVQESRLRVDALSNELLDLYNIGKTSGTETGRGLNARRMMAYEDFSLAKMELEKRAANGGRPLTDAERTEISKLQEQLAKTQKAHDDYVVQTTERLRQIDLDAALNKSKAQADAGPHWDKRILDFAENIVKKMETSANEARNRVMTKWAQPGATSILDPTLIDDFAIIGSAKIARLGLDLAKFTDAMIADFGPKIQPFIKEIWESSNRRLNESLKSVPEPVKRVVKTQKPADQRVAMGTQIKNRLSAGKKDTVAAIVQKVARTFVSEGIRDREVLIDKVHDFLKGIIPEITRREAMDAISGYGDFKMLRKGEIEVALRGMKGEMQQLAKLEDMAKGKPPSKTGIERRTPTDTERQLIKRVNDAKFKFQIPVQDPATQLKSALDTLKTQLTNKIKDYEQRLKEGDFDARPRRELVLDRTAMELKAKAEAVKRKWRAALEADRMKNRTKFERMSDAVARWKRGFVLSGFTTLGKLTTAAIQRMTFTPLEEVIGAGLGQFSGIKEVAKRAPREGGLSLKAEASALREAITQGMKDAYQVLQTGRGNLDLLFGKKDAFIGEMSAEQRSVIDMFGQIHGALKAPVKRAEFARSLQKRIEFAMNHGVDTTDPLVQTRLMSEAYQDANRSIFLQDNRAAGIVNSMEQYLERKGKGGTVPIAGKLSATFMRLLLPITKVPANIVAETIQYSGGGLARGSYNLVQAFRKGFDTLTPQQADLIMRDLKKGTIGSAFLLAGFLAPEVFGGYYEPGEKRRKGELKAMSVRTPMGDIPSWALHNPLLETLQVGATIRRVMDSRLKRSADTKGLPAGLMAGAVGLTEQVPFIREMSEVAKGLDARSSTTFWGELAKSSIVPQGVEQIARRFDRDVKGEPIPRKPRTFAQRIEMGIPILRQNVPIDYSKMR